MEAFVASFIGTPRSCSYERHSFVFFIENITETVNVHKGQSIFLQSGSSGDCKILSSFIIFTEVSRIYVLKL